MRSTSVLPDPFSDRLNVTLTVPVEDKLALSTVISLVPPRATSGVGIEWPDE